jgi:diaminopimelate decarboxylase
MAAPDSSALASAAAALAPAPAPGPPPLLTEAQARACIACAGGATPLYAYSEARLLAQADAALAFPAPFGLTVRFALKALPNAAVLRLFLARGLAFDASSGFEVRRALAAGVPARLVSLSAQELPADDAELAALLREGVLVNACSLRQLERLGRVLKARGGAEAETDAATAAAAQGPTAGAAAEVGLRFNPGVGSGGTAYKTNVGGPQSSFGIWHESAAEAATIARKAGLRVVRVHTHIGSGGDPAVWQRACALTLALARRFPDVRAVNLGGGFRVARVAGEANTDLQAVGAPVRALFEAFAAEAPADFAEHAAGGGSGGGGRRLRLELEPGTFLVANAGCVLSRVVDGVSTPSYLFAKLDTGMTEILRPSLSGAQHPIHALLPAGAALPRPVRAVVVVGHCCESGDLLTCAPGAPETLAPRDLPALEPGDLVAIGGAGAYCASMAATNYNSFPAAAEVMLLADGDSCRLIRRRQTLEQMLANESGC